MTVAEATTQLTARIAALEAELAKEREGNSNLRTAAQHVVDIHVKEEPPTLLDNPADYAGKMRRRWYAIKNLMHELDGSNTHPTCTGGRPMLSDDRLKQLIEYQNKWCAECELDDIEHIPRDGLWDTHSALTELAEARKILREALTHHEQCACSVKRRIEAMIQAKGVPAP